MAWAPHLAMAAGVAWLSLSRATPARLARTWTFPLGATLVVAAAAALSTGAVRLLLATTLALAITHPEWRHGLTADIDTTDRLTYTTRRHWVKYCDAAKLTDGDQRPQVKTTVGPLVHPWRKIAALLIRGHLREARRRQWIEHNIKLLDSQIGPKWPTVLEETARQFYDYPAATCKTAGNRYVVRITADRLPHVINVIDDTPEPDEQEEQAA